MLHANPGLHNWKSICACMFSGPSIHRSSSILQVGEVWGVLEDEVYQYATLTYPAKPKQAEAANCWRP